MTMSAGSLVNVDGQRNGGIQIKGENRSDILIRACVQATGNTEQEAAGGSQKHPHRNRLDNQR